MHLIIEKIETLLCLEVVKVENEHVAIHKHADTLSRGPESLIERPDSRPSTILVFCQGGFISLRHHDRA